MNSVLIIIKIHNKNKRSRNGRKHYREAGEAVWQSVWEFIMKLRGAEVEE